MFPFSKFSAVVLACALPCAVQAASYYVVTPGPVRAEAQPPVLEISVSLSDWALPSAMAGSSYDYDFGPHISVTGDSEFDAADVQFSSGELPFGLYLDAQGRLQGLPGEGGHHNVHVRADYKGESAERRFLLAVNKQLAMYDGVRTWSDGSLARSCKDYMTNRSGQSYAGATGDGVYRIDVDAAGVLAPVEVLCDMTTDGGGWTVFQARQGTSVDFQQRWEAYANGFGSVDTEYWLGNDRIAALTAAGATMQVDMQRVSGAAYRATYSQFKVGDASTKYRMSYVGFTPSSSFADSLAVHNGQPFTTLDQDNDSYSAGNCASMYKGGWWFRGCHESNLNGINQGVKGTYATGVIFRSITGYYESLETVTMKVRED